MKTYNFFFNLYYVLINQGYNRFFFFNGKNNNEKVILMKVNIDNSKNNVVKIKILPNFFELNKFNLLCKVKKRILNHNINTINEK